MESMPSHSGRSVMRSIVQTWKGNEFWGASINKILDKLDHSWPPKIPLYLFSGVPLSWVPYPRCFMNCLDYASSEVCVIWDVYSVLKEKQVVLDLPI
uniref:Uncharacterized protein n=1 Tax=Moniliophthora roreri TaxID=221103 RepID=A0A0W0G0V9_MONRR